MVKWQCSIATMETFQRIFDDLFALGPIMNNKMSYEMLPEHEGSKMAHIKVKGPMLVSNRSMITALYQETREGGERCVFHSTQGNEAQTAERAAQIGKDVVANMIVAFWSFKPIEGGVEIKLCQSFDPAGMIPGFLKTKMAKRLANAPQLMVDYLKNGTVPEAAF